MSEDLPNPPKNRAELFIEYWLATMAVIWVNAWLIMLCVGVVHSEVPHVPTLGYRAVVFSLGGVYLVAVTCLGTWRPPPPVFVCMHKHESP